MPAPKNPNTAAATAAATARRQRTAQERRAGELRAVGWLVVPPEAVAELPTEVVDRVNNVLAKHS
jgi:hypothetical protein